VTVAIELANLEPNSLRSTVCSIFVEGLRNDESSSTKHCPSGVNQLKCLISALDHQPTSPTLQHR